MPTPISELSDYDFKLLAYVKNHSGIHIDAITKKFKSRIASIEHRLNVLSRPDALPTGVLANTSYLDTHHDKNVKECGHEEFQHSKTYAITPLGEKVLQDYKSMKRDRFWDSVIKLWIPLIISLIAVAISIYGLFQPVDVRLIDNQETTEISSE